MAVTYCGGFSAVPRRRGTNTTKKKIHANIVRGVFTGMRHEEEKCLGFTCSTWYAYMRTRSGESSMESKNAIFSCRDGFSTLLKCGGVKHPKMTRFWLLMPLLLTDRMLCSLIHYMEDVSWDNLSSIEFTRHHT